MALWLLLLHPGAAWCVEITPLEQGWGYRWGDSPREADGSFSWLHGDAGEWSTIAYPSNPPGRDGRRMVWYRVRLPRIDARDPALFIYSIDTNAELYVGGRLCYAWGELDGRGGNRFRGWPWHLVELPRDAQMQEMHLRVYSDYRDIGLWGPILLGSRADLMAHLFARDAPRLAVGAASLLIGAALLILFLLQTPRQPMFLYLGLQTLALLLRAFARTHVKQLLETSIGPNRRAAIASKAGGKADHGAEPRRNARPARLLSLCGCTDCCYSTARPRAPRRHACSGS